MMRRAAMVATFALIVLVGTPGWAQDDEPASKEPDAESTAETNTKPNDDDASPDVFIPTEEISEDASVPFPVDI